MTGAIRAKRSVAVLVGAVVASALSIPTVLAQESAGQGAAAEHAADHVMVKVDDSTTTPDALGATSEQVLGDWFRVPVTPGETPEQAVERLSSVVGVASVELDYLVHVDPEWAPYQTADVGPSLIVNDPLVDFQWHLPAVQTESAWDESTGNGVVVAVVDSGISQGGEDLDCHTFVSPYNAITGTPGAIAAQDDNNHGTHVAGTVAQCTNNGLGVAGVAFNAQLMPVKVLDQFGNGSFSDVAEGIDWARTHGADVINLSLGCLGCTSMMVSESIEAAVDAGIVVVAASGNESASTVGFPASHPDVIGVGATDYNNTVAPYSNRGPELDVVAPGGDLGEDDNGDGQPDGVLQETFSPAFAYYWFQGTSMATPHVAGAAALIKSLAPGMSPEAVKNVLEGTADDLGPCGHDVVYGHGFIQIHDAIVAATTPDTTPPSWQCAAQLASSNLTGTSVTLSWPEARDERGVANYIVSRNGVELQANLVQTVDGDTTTYTVTNLTPGTEYEFEVFAEDSAGNRSGALSKTVTTLESVAPKWPASAEVYVTRFGEEELELSWTAATDNVGVTRYSVDLTGGSGVTVTGTEALVTGLSPGVLYFAEIRARDAAGNWSQPLTAPVLTARRFVDTPGTTFYEDILWMSGMDITRGCNPPANDLFCPDDPVTRGQMAAFFVRALGLEENTHPGFVDVSSDSTFARDIGILATAGITRGCNPPANDMFCPDDPVTRGQLAAFFVRALGLEENTHPGFVDVPAGSTFAEDIGRLATEGITRGCNPPANDMFCQDDPSTRGQLAAFFKRALGRS